MNRGIGVLLAVLLASSTGTVLCSLKHVCTCVVVDLDLVYSRSTGRL